MGIPIPVTDGPVLLSRSVSKPYLVYNTGQNTAYIGTDSSVSPLAYAFPLAPGAVFQWTEISTDVYAVANTGKTTTLILAPEASAMAFGTLNVAGTVGVNGPVDTSGSQVGVSGTVGNVPQNKPTLLATSTNTWLAAMGSPLNIQAIPSLNISAYASLIINVSDVSNLPAFGSGGMVDITVQQFVGTVPVSTYRAQWLIGSCNSLLQVPVVGTSAQITGRYISAAAGTNNGTLTIQAIGSSEIVANPIYVSYNPSAKGNVPTGGYYQGSTGVGSVTDYVNSKSGPAVFALIPSTGSSNGNGSILALDFDNPNTPVQIYGFVPTAAGSGTSFQAILPMRPLQVLTRATVGTGMLSSLTQ